MKEETPVKGPLAVALMRLAIIAELIAAPPPKGELAEKLDELEKKLWWHPVKQEWTKVHRSTIERWYYTAKDAAEPLAVLTQKQRSDAGSERVTSPALLAALRLQYEQHPGWSRKLHADNLKALAEEDPESYGEAPSYSTVVRRMRSRGWPRKRTPRNPTPAQRQAAKRLASLEVRSYEVPYVHGLWHLDFHEGSLRVVDHRAVWHTPYLMGVLDDCSRVCCHVQWYLAENAENLFHGLRQAFYKRGLPRALMEDNGSAMRAEENVRGLARLDIDREPTLEHSPYQNGKQENFWTQIEGRLLPMIESVKNLSLGFLNRVTQAWVEQEYNRSVHGELGCSPLDRLLQGPDVSRRAPEPEPLDLAFALQRTRTQRKSDGTISIEGVRFELPARLYGLDKPTVRYQRWNLSRAWIYDERTDTVLARIRPIDRARNADGRRRAREVADDTAAMAPDAKEPIPALMRKYLAQYAATGLPPAYLPKDELEQDDD